MSKKGFTLIELLVVIAIIGILASIVLVSFPTATKKAKDSRIISAVGQMRIVAAAQFASSNPSSYAGITVTTPEEMDALSKDVVANLPSGSTFTNSNITIQTAAPAGEDYCIYAKLNDTGNYCVDSRGFAGNVAATTLCTTATDPRCQ